MLNLALVLSTAPGSSTLRHAHASEIWSRLPSPCRVDREWLATGEAWQASVTAEDAIAAAAVRGIAEDVLGGLAVDINLVANEIGGRRKKLLVADMESTIIAEELIDELAAHAGRTGRTGRAGRAGLRDEISSITQRAMRGEIAFEGALRERVALLEGLDAKVLEEVYGRVTLTPGAETLIKTMRKHGAHCALVSGGFTIFAERIARRLGFECHQANRLEIRDGKLTGTVAEPILGREAKLAALKRLAAERGLDMAETIAVGDGANDLAMIKAAGLGVAFRAKPKVVAEAKAVPNGAVVTHGDLTALLYLQGYRRDEFAG
jgi:phosphoserine phosphatase